MMASGPLKVGLAGRVRSGQGNLEARAGWLIRSSWRWKRSIQETMPWPKPMHVGKIVHGSPWKSQFLSEVLRLVRVTRLWAGVSLLPRHTLTSHSIDH